MVFLALNKENFFSSFTDLIPLLSAYGSEHEAGQDDKGKHIEI